MNTASFALVSCLLAAAAPGAVAAGAHVAPAPVDVPQFTDAQAVTDTRAQAKAAFRQALHQPRRTAKLSAPVSFSWRVEEAPAVAEPVGITLDFKALAALSGEVWLRGEAGLELMSPDHFELPWRVAGEHWTQRVEVIAATGAPHYLNVVVATVAEGGERRMQGFAVPVAVDPEGARKAMGQLAATPAGTAVVSLPAAEEIVEGSSP